MQLWQFWTNKQRVLFIPKFVKSSLKLKIQQHYLLYGELVISAQIYQSGHMP